MRPVDVPQMLKTTNDHVETCNELNELLGRLGVRRPVIVAGTGVTRAAAEALQAAMAVSSDCVFVDSASFEQVQCVETVIFNRGCDCVAAVGGGAVLDAGKYAAFRCHLPFVAVPTQVSHDGIASPIAVIIGEDGRRRSLGARMPEAVIAPLHLIRTSPLSARLAGVGDLLSNFTALEDWRIAHEIGRDVFDDFAAIMSKNAAELVRRALYDNRVQDDEIIRSLIEGLMLSGIAMAISGSSRPCSGSEHLLSHAIDFLGWSKVPHGVQVGCLSLFAAHLQKRNDVDYIRQAVCIGLPIRVAQVAPAAGRDLEQLFAVARSVRPGRYTVLDLYSDRDLVREYHAYEAMVNDVLITREVDVGTAWAALN